MTNANWQHSEAQKATAPAPTFEDDNFNHEIHNRHAVHHLMNNSAIDGQWQSASLRVVIVRESRGLSICRLQRRGYPMVRVCFAPDGKTVEQLQAALENVSPVADVKEWEAAITAAVVGA